MEAQKECEHCGIVVSASEANAMMCMGKTCDERGSSVKPSHLTHEFTDA